MAYFIYKIFDRDGDKVLEYIEEHDEFIDAKTRVRAMRAEMAADADYTVKIMFAASRGEAETLLTERREAPVLKEWEK